MTELMTGKYTLKNLDCAACAAKIENGLKSVDGVDEASVDFANLLLHVKATDLDRVVSAVGKIDPGVEVVQYTPNLAGANDRKTDAEKRHLKKEYLVLAVAGILFFVQLFFEAWFQASGYGVLETVLAVSAYLLVGGNVLVNALRTVRKGTFFDENVLMVIATCGAFAIHAYSEAIGVMLFYKIGEMLQQRAVNRSRRSIKKLLAVKPDRAHLLTLGGYQVVDPESVKVGDTILVKPGEKIPLDGRVITGTSQVDPSALTGESYPIRVQPGDAVLAGQINNTGALTLLVSRPFKDSSIAKVMELVENAAARKAKTEKFITTFARYYTPAVVLIAAGIAFVPPLFIAGAAFETWIYRALVLLVISCPCALVVSIPLGYFGGIGQASRQGILIKGSNYIDALSGADTVVFDKTGTLTRGVFSVLELTSLNGYSKQQLLEFAAAAEYHSNHPIATAIKTAFAGQGRPLDESLIVKHTDMPGQGVMARYGDHTILVGNDHLLHARNVDHARCDFNTTVAHIVVDGVHAGYMAIGDEVRPDAPKAIRNLRRHGIRHIAMLTGDNDCTAAAVADRLRLDSYHANLLPEEKVARLEAISARHAGQKVVYVGDGINDAPVIARADVGVAMGAMGSDAAIETADVVLMQDSLEKLAEALGLARRTRTIVWQNIVLAFGIKGLFIIFGAMGMASMWEAVFADMGTALLAVLNSTRILSKRVGAVENVYILP